MGCSSLQQPLPTPLPSLKWLWVSTSAAISGSRAIFCSSPGKRPQPVINTDGASDCAAGFETRAGLLLGRHAGYAGRGGTVNLEAAESRTEVAVRTA